LIIAIDESCGEFFLPIKTSYLDFYQTILKF